MLRRKKEAVEAKGSSETTNENINPKADDDAYRIPPKYTFGRPREEEKINLMEVLSGLLQRLKSLDKQRTDLRQEIERLGEEAEKEAEKQEKELSTLMEQAVALKEVLEAMHSRNK
ncbi:MAG TPA: hypothetical protein VMT42_04250 [candidate division Zixibacteria bacterium]|nr:hypothetical protein [candidate division Zixibacteria bacterium]